MSLEKLRPSFTFTEDRLKELQAVVPEAFADGRINWDTLREALGENLEGESQEHFGLFWPGKREARKLAAMPSKGTLIPQPEQGVDEENTHNIFIEGDNLEVLKLLQKSYAGRIKMIYIDPPYNTGNDFVYTDDYSEPLAAYLMRTGQVDELGNLLVSNKKIGGRFHSNWLSMIYPRLQLGKNMLSQDGVIFISIDDHEASNLRLLANEVFGEENFIGQITIMTNPKGRVLQEHFSQTHDYLLVYTKDSEFAELSRPKTDEEIIRGYTEIDEQGSRFRTLELRNTHHQFGRFNRSNLFFPLFIDPSSAAVFLDSGVGRIEVLPIWDDGFEGCWTWDRSKVSKDNSLLVGKKINGNWKVFRKSYAHSSDGEVARKKLQTIWIEREYHTEVGQKELDDLMGDRVFPSPKPIGLIKTLLSLVTNSDEESIILDFFGGSGSTAHAVLAKNAEDNGQRHFILVQLPEPIDDKTQYGKNALKAGYKNISDIGKERIRRVIREIDKTKKEQPELSPTQKTGFECLSLDQSNFIEWEQNITKDVSQLELRFQQAEMPLMVNWKPKNLLVEILLLQGFPLDSRIRPMPEFKKNEVKEVSSEFCQHRLFVCLDKQIRPETLWPSSCAPRISWSAWTAP
jgi:adenine-specific DNA-methyltransferase